MKRILREYVQPPLKIGTSITEGDRVSFFYNNKKYTGKVSGVYVRGERVFYSFDRAVSDEGKIIKDILVRDDDILEVVI